MKFKYLISDMDGVLLDTENLILKMYKKSAAYHGFEFSEEEFLKTIGIDTIGTRAILEPNIPVDYDDFFNKREEYFMEYIAQYGAPVKPFVLEGLKKIKDTGIISAVATSTAKDRALLRLQKTGISQYFDSFVFGDEIMRGKPAPDIFLRAAQRIGAEPEECVVFEDSPAGIAAAKSAGMHAVLIPDMKEPNDELKSLADHTTVSFIAAAEYIIS